MHSNQQTKILIWNLNTNFQVIDFEYKYQVNISFDDLFKSMNDVMYWNACPF